MTYFNLFMLGLVIGFLIRQFIWWWRDKPLLDAMANECKKIIDETTFEASRQIRLTHEFYKNRAKNNRNFRELPKTGVFGKEHEERKETNPGSSDLGVEQQPRSKGE